MDPEQQDVEVVAGDVKAGAKVQPVYGDSIYVIPPSEGDDAE